MSIPRYRVNDTITVCGINPKVLLPLLLCLLHLTWIIFFLAVFWVGVNIFLDKNGVTINYLLRRLALRLAGRMARVTPIERIKNQRDFIIQLNSWD